MLQEPSRSPYDWQFFFSGFPVRVTWLFWVISAAIGYHWAESLHELYASRLQLETPGMPVLLAIWVAVSFVSILIHELGHALAMRWFGTSAHIVLYHFGGLAVPDGAGAWRRPRSSSHMDQLIISAAGPALQLFFGISVAAIAMSLGLRIGPTANLVEKLIPLPTGDFPSNAALMALIDSTVYTSIFWALLNLIPVLPLDGGRIAQCLIGQTQGTSGHYEATVLSIVVGIIAAIYCFQGHHTMAAMFFGYFAFSNYQSLKGNHPML
ncbi:MAG: site-2 protease family protein [Pirellulaceae bacterium]|nr:site-2 protease family protein [Pirellulaceae bacterium]